MSIEGNVKARALANELLEMVTEAWQESDVHPNAFFWRYLFDGVANVAGIDTAPKIVERGEAPMDDATARQFGLGPMPFGQYANRQIDAVPLEYLLWLDAQPDFRVNLRRYLASKRIQAEQPE